jgi:hypothetical protein
VCRSRRSEKSDCHDDVRGVLTTSPETHDDARIARAIEKIRVDRERHALVARDGTHSRAKGDSSVEIALIGIDAHDVRIVGSTSLRSFEPYSYVWIDCVATINATTTRTFFTPCQIAIRMPQFRNEA